MGSAVATPRRQHRKCSRITQLAAEIQVQGFATVRTLERLTAEMRAICEEMAEKTGVMEEVRCEN